MSREADAIVIGGGVAGLAAAGELGRRGLRVVLLEARERLGGRVLTLQPRGWPGPVELGAEFVHEGNPAFWKKFRRHRIATKLVPDSHWLFNGVSVAPIKDVTAQLERVTDRIHPREMEGWSFAKFLHRLNGSITPADRQLATEFVQGFEAAPTTEMSAVAMAGATLDTSEQFSMPGGYTRLVTGLVTELTRAGGQIELRSVVNAIGWEPGAVAVRCGSRMFTARAVVITLPLGVLQAKPPQRGAVAFAPVLRAKQKLISRLRMGHVIRLTLRIDATAWPVLVPEALQRERGGFGFLHSHVHGVPVWWSLSGQHIITGWSGGPNALALAGRSENGIFERALSSLREIFGVPKNALRRAVTGYATHNWSRDPYSRGAYSFVVAGLDDGAKQLRAPVEDTLFFAGEATADGEEIGTVHGALGSGLRAAKEMAAVLKTKARAV